MAKRGSGRNRDRLSQFRLLVKALGGEASEDRLLQAVNLSDAEDEALEAAVAYRTLMDSPVPEDGIPDEVWMREQDESQERWIRATVRYMRVAGMIVPE